MTEDIPDAPTLPGQPSDAGTPADSPGAGHGSATTISGIRRRHARRSAELPYLAAPTADDEQRVADCGWLLARLDAVRALVERWDDWRPENYIGDERDWGQVEACEMCIAELKVVLDGGAR